MSEKKVAVIGLGIIGTIWSGHYEKSGKLSATWNRTAKPEAPAFEPELSTIPEKADVIQIVIAGPPEVETVLSKLLPGLGEKHLVIQSSTIDPESARKFSGAVTARGARYVEAPFTGSRPAAEDRKTVFYLGGERASVASAEVYLSELSQDRFFIGDAAQAASLKLAMNLQLAIMMEALSESLVFARRAGISDETYFKVLEKNAASSGWSRLKEPKLMAGDVSPQFSIKHMLKDVRLALKSGGGKPLPLTEAVRECFETTSAKGYSDNDYASLISVL